MSVDLFFFVFMFLSCIQTFSDTVKNFSRFDNMQAFIVDTRGFPVIVGGNTGTACIVRIQNLNIFTEGSIKYGRFRPKKYYNLYFCQGSKVRGAAVIAEEYSRYIE